MKLASFIKVYFFCLTDKSFEFSFSMDPELESLRRKRLDELQKTKNTTNNQQFKNYGVSK